MKRGGKRGFSPSHRYRDLGHGTPSATPKCRAIPAANLEVIGITCRGVAAHSNASVLHGSLAGYEVTATADPESGAILVATDLSDLERLMPFALEMAAGTGARLLLFHVLPASASLTVDAAGMPFYDPACALEYAGKKLESWSIQAHARGLLCETIVREGRAAQEIVSATRQFRADRLILGTRSRSRLGKLVLGSVAEQVLRSVNLPVFTVGPEAHLQEAGSRPQPAVLFATTLGETSRPSAVLACRLAAEMQAKLVLLTVLPLTGELQQMGIPSTLDDAASRELAHLAAEARGDTGVVIEQKVAHGLPAIEILAESAALHARLVVLGAEPHSFFERLTPDRTIHRVLAHARCPVLTLRHAAHQPAEHHAEQMAAR